MSKEMRNVKARLYIKYGTKCEVCGKEFRESELTGHHIIMRSKGGSITEDNILIACYNCHFGRINHMMYDSEEYWKLMKQSLEHRNKP